MFRNKVWLPGIALSVVLALIPAAVMAENAEALLKRASNAIKATPK